MTVLVAFDSFKGSLTASQACESFAAGVRSVSSDKVITMPITDGGDGLIACLSPVLMAQGWQLSTAEVTGPYGGRVRADFLIKGEHAVIEMAGACGLTLVEPDKRSVLEASSFGLGELISAAVASGAKTLHIGLGGSATNDLGLGCMQALGVELSDQCGNPLHRPFRAKDLLKVASVATDSFMNHYGDLEVIAICDVDNPLLGVNGSTAVFAPQKGARAEELLEMERSMSSAASVLAGHFKKNVSESAGAGAAGGMGAALKWFFNAKMLQGIEAVLDIIGFDAQLDIADSVITGEGSFDEQSLSGKAPMGVLRRAQSLRKPVTLIAGQILASDKTLTRLGFQSAYELRSMAASATESMNRAAEFLYALGQRWAEHNKI